MEHRQKRVSRKYRLMSLIAALLVVTACTGDEAGGTPRPPAAEGGEGEGVEVVAWFNGETVPGDEFGALEARWSGPLRTTSGAMQSSPTCCGWPTPASSSRTWSRSTPA